MTAIWKTNMVSVCSVEILKLSTLRVKQQALELVISLNVGAVDNHFKRVQIGVKSLTGFASPGTKGKHS
jgi:hypothetical protein